MSELTDQDLVAIMDEVGLIPGQHWKLMKVDGRSEIVVSLDGVRMLAARAPDQEAAQAIVRALDERFPGQ